MSTSLDVLTDVARRAWGPVTIRVAWTLLLEGVAVKPAVIRDARDHVWFHLEAGTPTELAVDLAESLTRAYVARARGRAPREPFADDLTREVPRHWRARLHHNLAKRPAWVLRLHYGDRISLDRIAVRMGEDELGVDAAREGLREVVRRLAAEDGRPLDGMPTDRLDFLIHRLATMQADGTPALTEVADGLHPDWLDRCLTCSRAYALVRRGVLQCGDLVPPRNGSRPHHTAVVLALHFHPDGRHLRKKLARDVPGTAFPVGSDLLLLDGSDASAWEPVLRRVAELGRPRREHLRGALLEGEGRWSRHGLLGPLVDRVDDAVRATTWGRVDGLGELPAKLPAPPSAAPAWAAVAALLVATLYALQWASTPPPPPVDHPLEAQATPGRGGVWVAFDVDEEAHVVVVRERSGQLDLLLDSTHTADKIRLARGDGSYRLHTQGDAVLLASSVGPVDDLAGMISLATTDAAPLQALASAIQQQQRGADVWMYRR
jgi:hypothetical protein